MKALSILDEVVKSLEEHENALRIRKLIYGICKNTWENDINTLHSFKLKELLQELQLLNPTLDYLKYSLDRIVKTLNKPAEYALVANVILLQMGRLYPDTEESTQQIPLNRNSSPTPAANSVPQQASTYQPILGWDTSKEPYDSFELRLEIMKYTNPLRAKILTFSTLYHKFDFDHQDWVTIRNKELDNLLLKLFYACETIVDLEYRLSTTARQMQPRDENTQAAGAILQAMKRYYVNRQPGQYQTQAFDINLEEFLTTDNTDIDDDDDQTCQIRKSSDTKLS